MRFGKTIIYEDDVVYEKLTPEGPGESADELLEYEYDIIDDYGTSFINKDQLTRFIKACSELHKRPMSNDEYASLMKIVEGGEYEGEFAPHYIVLAVARIIKENFTKFNPDIALTLVDQKLESTYDLQRAYEDHYQTMLDEFRKPFLKESDIVMEKSEEISVATSLEHPMLSLGLIPRRK